MKEKLFSNLHYLAFSLFSFFPLIPNKFKGIPVIILFLVSIIIFIKERKYQYPIKKVLLFSSLYLIYIVSLSYTENFNHTDKLLSTRLSLLVVPISIGFILSTKRRTELLPMVILFKLNTVVTTIYSLLIVFYLSQLGVFSGIMTLNDAQAYITNEMWGINQHPIYASIFIGISVILTSIILIKEKKKSVIIVLIISLIVMVGTLLVLSRKSVLITLFFSLLSPFLLQRDKINIKNYYLILVTLFFIIFIASPYVRERFSELFKKSTYTSIKEKNSTSLRYGIYTCVFDKIVESPLFGYGIGDVQIELDNCYKNESVALYKLSYNSHNQYLSYFLSSGVLGFVLLIFVMFKSTSKAIKDKNLFLLSMSVFFAMMMLFENILERQSGVILFSFYINLLTFANFKNVNPVKSEN